jgi:hypothetical protein
MPSNLREHLIALLDCLCQHRGRQRLRARHKRHVALAAIPPIRCVPHLDHHVRTAQADGGTSAGFTRCDFAATALGLRLEHAPAIVAGVNAQVRVSQHERDVIAPDLLAGTSPEAGVAAIRSPMRPASRSLTRSLSSAVSARLS